MGRAYDGGYAEYTLIFRERVLPIHTSLPWDVLPELPETRMTAWGSLVEAMEVRAVQTLLLPGGTLSVGIAAASLARHLGLRVPATIRDAAKTAALRENGADDVVIDAGAIADDHQRVPNGVDGVLELVGTATLLDSLLTVRQSGIVCNTRSIACLRTEPDHRVSCFRVHRGSTNSVFANGSTVLESGGRDVIRPSTVL